MIEQMKEVFELATNTTVLINEILKLKKNNKNQDEDEAIISSKGNYARIGSSGDYARIGSSGNSAQIGSSGDSARIGSSGDSAQIGSSGNYAQIGSSGNSAQIGSSGNYARIGSSGYSAQIGSSGDYARIGSSGNYAQIGSSGNYARIGSSGYSAQIESDGKNAVIAAIGYNSYAKAKKGSWLTLAEYANNGIVSYVKTEYVDGEKVKEDTFYTLYNKEFHELEDIDGINTIILKKHKNIISGVTLDSKEKCYIFSKDNINAHGKTVKQAYLDWLFKTSDRDVSKYKNISQDEKHDLNFWVIAYRTITGACSFGTNDYLENNKDKYKPEMTLKEVLKATENQYGHNTFRKFFAQRA